jgi:rRNA maturation protein Nop10
MGLKSYEKIYTLKEVRDADGRSIAVIDMNTIPSSEVEPKYRGQQAEVDVPKTFDTNDSYTGGGEFDLKAGRIENYHEDLEASWTVALPAKQDDTGEPVVLKMSASHVYSIERVK